MTQPSTSPPAAPVNSAALRLARTPMDMTKAVLVLLVPVILAVVAYVYFFGGSNVIVIDPSGAYSEARQANHFAVLEPQNLPPGWKAVSSAWANDDNAWVLRVGYVAPGGGGIQLVESDRPADALIQSELGNTGEVAASVQIGDRTWGKMAASTRSDRALVDTESGRTVIIMGQATDRELADFAAALH
jgi:hypothetical protein